MNLTQNRILTWALSLVLLCCCGLAGYFQESYILFIPVGVIVVLFLLQHPDVLLYVLLASIPWSIEFNFTESLGTDLPDEPLMLMSAFAALIMVIYKRKELAERKWHPLVIVLILQFAWILFTAILSTFAIISFKYTLAKSWYLLAFVALPLFLFDDPKKLKRASMVLLWSMLSFMVIAIIRHAGNGWTFDKINKSLEPFYRNHVNYSALLVLMVPILLGLLKFTRAPLWRIFLKLVFVVTLGALYFSYARGAWLALVAGMMAYWILKKRWLVHTYILFLFALLLSVLVLRNNDTYLKFAPHYKTTIFHTDFSEHLVATYKMNDMSTVERYYRWVAGVRMIPESWVHGFGPSSFYNNYKSYTVPAFKTWVSKNEEHSTIHNYFLLLIVEQGLAGLVIFLVLVGMMFWYAQKVYHRTSELIWKVSMAAVCSLLIMICTVNFLSDLIETDKIGSVFYLCLATIVIADRKTRSQMDQQKDQTV